MNSNDILKAMTCLVAIALLVALAYEYKQNGWAALADPRLDSPSGLDTLVSSDIEAGQRNASQAGGAESRAGDVETLSEESGRLATGVLGPVPGTNQIRSIATVPWFESDANQAFNNAQEFACELLLPGIAVKPALTRTPLGRRGVLGRVPVVTIGLEVDEDSRNQLPKASRSAIEGYMRNHRLVIEPMIYQDEKGQAYFATDCRAAFYPVSAPTTTIKPEPMIEEAIRRFRAIGVLNESNDSTARTLVMAFRYVEQDKEQITKTAIPREITELLFLHIAPQDRGNLPVVEAFTTSGGRQNLRRLSTHAGILEDPLPMISASVRFDKFVLMGLYPSDPIVTGVRQRAAGVLSMSTILKLTKSADPEDRLTFEEVLDQFSSIVSGS
jgi:hypothetical protein